MSDQPPEDLPMSPSPLKPSPINDAQVDAMEDLVAYLDNEVDAQTRQHVEAKIQHDPVVRDEAEKLKRTWDLLDYLPKAEASPDFTQRTVSKLMPVKSSQVLPRVTGDRPSTGSLPTPAITPLPGPTTSSPSTSLAPLPTRSPIAGMLIWLMILVVIGTSAFVAASYIRSKDSITITDANRNSRDPDMLALPDLRVIQNVSIYWGVDDLDFAYKLEQSELFGEDE